MEIFRLVPGATRLVVSIPHAGTHVPAAIEAQMTDSGRALTDTDWHVDRLYDFLGELGATVIVATHSRYVVDLNRPADGSPLYPGQVETGVVPLETFAGAPIWQDRHKPDARTTAERLARYWRPYHDRLRTELERVLARHGSVLLWDAHSIRSRVPRLFAGELPVYNLGTNDGRSCGAELRAGLASFVSRCPPGHAVLDARFKGGYITRGYGEPARGIQAVQLELAQRSYMDEATGQFEPAAAEHTRRTLRELLATALG